MLRFLRPEVYTFIFALLINAIHEQTLVFFIDRLFCTDF
jgi:hypothetical protein